MTRGPGLAHERGRSAGHHRGDRAAGRLPRVRLAIVLGLLAATTLTAFSGSAAFKPAEADAWAWRDACTALLNNRTPSQGGVRPVAYVAVPPNPGSYAAFFAYAAVGIPVNQALPLVNVGYPVPAYGCHGTVATTSPQGATSCAFSAPTTGANHFDCSNNVNFKIIQDDDDIAANVFINTGSGSSSGPSGTGPPPEGKPALRPENLPGKRWVSKDKFGGAGVVSRLMQDGSLPDSCSSGAHGSPDFAPEVVSSTLLRNRRGPRTVGAVIGTYDSPQKARATTEDALSDHSIGCLQRLMRSDRFEAQSVRPLPSGAFGGVTQRRLVVVDRRADGERVGHMTVIGVTSERQSAVVMLSSGLRRPLGPRVTRAAVRSVLEKIDA